jgi:deoxycytidylate deaminase
MPPYKEICSDYREKVHTKMGFHGIPEYVKVGVSNQQRNFLNIASKVAETSTMVQRHGAVVVKAGRVMSVGINKWRNPSLVSINYYDPNLTVHAEIDALNRVPDAHGATIYVSRVDKFGQEQYSRPCSRCEKALADAGVKAVIYTS